MAQTIYRLAEQILSLIEGGKSGVASSITTNEIKISIGQVLNQKLRIDYFNTGLKLGEAIPNTAVIAKYDDIPVVKYGATSKTTLPVKPLSLPRNMGVWSIYMSDDASVEFIPLQMGQSNLLKSQLMINDLLGQVGYEVRGLDVYFTKDITKPSGTSVNMELSIMDISNYGDYDILPIPPEMEWEVVQEVFKMYMAEPIADKVVSATSKEQKGIPIDKQNQD